MAIYLATVVAMCTLVVLWAIGLDPDVDGLIALAIIGIGILVHMKSSPAEEEA